jgi:hypothetical protein
MEKRRRIVKYERSILTYTDILGFRELVATKTAGEISRAIRIAREVVQPRQFKSSIPQLDDDDFRNFSDLCLIRRVIARKGKFSAIGQVHAQILHIVHVQSILIADEGILLRGGITVGDVALSYGQLFGPAVIRGFELEHEVAKFPRIVVGQEVLDEVKQNRALWIHDRETELKSIKDLLRRDSDGEYFVDYLRVVESELDDPRQYAEFLKKHKALIDQGLRRYKANASVLPKYKWLREYHRTTLKYWRERRSRKSASAMT